MNREIYIRDGRAPIPQKAITSRIMSAIKGKNTKPELALRKELWHLGIKGYRLHWKKAPGRPDISFPGKKLAIFVNGCFWHRCPNCQPPLPKNHSRFWKEKFKKNTVRDQQKIKLLMEQDWATLEIWECQIKKKLKACVHKVKRLIEK